MNAVSQKKKYFENTYLDTTTNSYWTYISILTLVLLELNVSFFKEQCRSGSAGFWWSQLIKIYTVLYAASETTEHALQYKAKNMKYIKYLMWELLQIWKKTDTSFSTKPTLYLAHKYNLLATNYNFAKKDRWNCKKIKFVTQLTMRSFFTIMKLFSKFQSVTFVLLNKLTLFPPFITYVVCSCTKWVALIVNITIPD